MLDHTQELENRTQSRWHDHTPVWSTVAQFFHVVGVYLYELRAVLCALPVAGGAIWLACRNIALLPETVVLPLLSGGCVPKEVAVIVPLGITALCMLLMLYSRRVLYPWLITLSTLAIPLLIRVLNLYLV